MFPAREEVYIGEMKVQFVRILLSFCSTDDTTQYCYLHTSLGSKTVKQQFDSPLSENEAIINH